MMINETTPDHYQEEKDGIAMADLVIENVKRLPDYDELAALLAALLRVQKFYTKGQEDLINEAADAITVLKAQCDDHESFIACIQQQYDALKAERDEFRMLLNKSRIYVESQAGAEHMLDGFKPKRRPIGNLVDAINKVSEKTPLQQVRDILDGK